MQIDTKFSIKYYQTKHRETIDENDLKTSRKDLPQLQI